MYVGVDNIMIEQYDKFFYLIFLDKHAPMKNIFLYVVDMHLNEWLLDTILTLKSIRLKIS